MRSRKKARQVTTLFHKLTKLRDDAILVQDTTKVQQLDLQIKNMGGFQEYQRASQLNTKLHSTSKWVLKSLSDRGLLEESYRQAIAPQQGTPIPCSTPLRLLEIGAINTELLEAARKSKSKNTRSIHVRAIDLHSSHPDIEETDFLQLPIDPVGFDVIVCSMVLNYVSMPEDRGRMLRLIFQQLKPEGLCFLTLPKLCLDQSQYITKGRWENLLTGDLGFTIEGTKETPKIYFWILQRPASESLRISHGSNHSSIERKGKKCRNSFNVILR
jgi:25S rRNA (adenine2142-N1)-methyltransferase